MKRILAVLGVILAGFVTSFIVSSLFLGYENTLIGLNVFTRRLIPRENPEKIFAQADSTAGRVLGIEAESEYDTIDITSVKVYESEPEPAPFIIPTDGIAAHALFLYDPVKHDGVDIWTRVDGKGLTGSKGNPVYAACSGTVTRVFAPNQEIEIICEDIDESFADYVPSLKVKTLYSHMGDAVTGEWYHSLRVGQTVQQGELIGYQGNISSFAPWNRVTHLHFGVYDLTQSGRPSLDPSDYIGVSATKLGQKFEVNIDTN